MGNEPIERCPECGGPVTYDEIPIEARRGTLLPARMVRALYTAEQVKALVEAARALCHKIDGPGLSAEWEYGALKRTLAPFTQPPTAGAPHEHKFGEPHAIHEPFTGAYPLLVRECSCGRMIVREDDQPKPAPKGEDKSCANCGRGYICHSTGGQCDTMAVCVDRSQWVPKPTEEPHGCRNCGWSDCPPQDEPCFSCMELEGPRGRWWKWKPRVAR